MKKLIAMMLVISLIFTASFGYADTLKLPKALQIIDAESFYGTSSVDEVVVPYGATEIRSKAFAGSSIQSIYIPDTVEFIAEDAFEGADDVTIYAPSESYAEEYAVGHDYLWQDAGNQYSIDQFKAAQELYENLEYGEEGMLDLEGKLTFDLINTEGFTDEAVLRTIEEYNALQQEAAALMETYTQSVTDMTDALSDLGTAVEESSVEYTDDGLTYSDSNFTYSVTGDGMDGLEEDFEIVSVTASEDSSKLIFEVVSGGKTFFMESNTEGVTFNDGTMNLKARSSEGAFDVSFVAKAGSTSEDHASLLDKISAMLMTIRAAWDGYRIKVALMVDKGLELVDKKLAAKQTLENLLLNPGDISDEGFAILKKNFAIAKLEYEVAQRAATGLQKAFSKLTAFNCIASITTIVTDIQKWNELGKIYEHAHPLPSEMSDSEKVALIQQMLDDCRTARTAYVCDVINSFLSLIDEISTIVTIVTSMTGAGAPVGLLGKAAVAAGLKATRTMIVNIFAGYVLGITASLKYESTFEKDKQLHGGVTGVVTDALTGKPVRYVTVEVDGMTVNTNSKGEYQVNLPEGQYTLGFVKRGYGVALKDVTVKELGTYVECNVILHPNGSLAGKVVDAETNLPLAGVTVRYDYHETNTDIEGKYILSAEPGSEQLTFTAEGYETWSVTAECESGMTKIYDAALQKKQENTPTPEPPDTPTVSYTSQDDFDWNTGWVGSTRIAAPYRYNGSDSAISIPPVYYRYIINEYTGEVTDVYEYTVTRIDGIHSSSLTSVIIPNTVTEIGISAFRDCTSLTSVTIPNSVTSIGYSAFYGCTNLTSITIPDSVTSISTNSLFAGCSSLTSVTLPDCTTEIGDTAFRDCSSLTSIEIPDSITRIGIAAFSGCSSLTSIPIPNSVTEIGWNAFIDCSSLTSVEIPNGVTSIASQAFRGCSGLTSVAISNGVTEIGDLAFYDCSGLPNIELPGSITSIGKNAFSYCSSLTSFEIPSGITEIGASTFESCSSLKSIKIPESVTSIGESAFINCSSLTDITIPDEETVIRNRVFRGCSSLTNVIIPDGVTMIETEAFSGCSSLTSIVIPEGVTSIGSTAFNGCTSLASVTLPESLTSIGSIAFQMCYRLSSITIPKGVTSIDSSAFNGSSLMTAYVSTQYAADYFAQYYPSVVVNWKE